MTGTAPLDRYDQDEAFRARIVTAYQRNQPRFIHDMITMAVAEGYDRAESVAFAKAVCAQVRADLGQSRD